MLPGAISRARSKGVSPLLHGWKILPPRDFAPFIIAHTIYLVYNTLITFL